MFCRNCGKELSEGAVFCGNCGTAVSAAAPAPAETSQAANAQAETPAPAPAPAEAGQAADAQAETPAPAPAPAEVSQAADAQAETPAPAPAPAEAGQAANAQAETPAPAPAPAEAGQAADAQAETPAPAPAPVKKKKKKKGLAVAIVLLLLIAAASTAGFVLWNNNDFRCWLDVRQANKMYDAEDYASAVDTYLQALERVEDSSEAIDGLVQVAQAYEKEENYEDALAIYEQILALDSENQKALGGQRDCYLTLGNEALKQERYENALAHYEKVRKINKTLDSDEGNEAVQDGQLRAYMGLAKQNLADFKYDKAREYFDNVLADADRDSDLYDQAKRGRAQATLVLGLASFQTDDYKTAETYYREILDEESVGSRAYQALAELYVAKDDVEGAISILEEGTGLYDDGALREQLTALRESLKPVYDFTPLRDENGNVYDLGGMEITLRTTWFEEEASADSAYGEALAAWRQWVQETYNFTFRVDTSLDFDSMDDTFRDYVTGGGDDNNYVFDVAAPRPGLTDFLNGGLLYDVASLGCMDFNSPKYALNKTHELFTRGDAVYGFHAGYPSPAQGIYFNKRLLEQLTGMTADDLYDLQRNGQWTWSKFEEILEKIQDNSDVDGDGVTDVYGFGGSTDDWVTNIVFSNGGRWFDRVDGKLSCTAQDPRTTEGLAFAKKLMEAGYWYRNPDVDSSSSLSYEDVISAFRDESKIVFLPERAYNMLPKGLFSKDPAVGSPAADDYGFLMFPKGDSAEGHTNVSSETVCVIPACYDADRAWKIAFAYDQYFELVPGFEDHNPHLSAFHASVNDVRAVEETIARMCTEGCSVDYASILDGVAVSEDLQQFPAGKDAAALIKAAMPKWQKAADAANGR